MNITRHNCEAFFLDYHEGNLSPVQQAEVLLFLEENPGLKEIFEEYENISLEQEKVFLPGKETMKKKYSAEGIESLLSYEITPDNCEQFFIAYVEGQLPAERISELNSFLVNNPGFQKEFELFKKTKLPLEKISLSEKESLKKSLITKENREEYFIRSAENDLTASERKHLQIFLRQNPQYQKEHELFRKTILVPEKISFSAKAALKKRERKPVFINLYSRQTFYYAAAAVILLFIGLFFFLQNNNHGKKLLADKTEKAVEIKSSGNQKTSDKIGIPIKQIITSQKTVPLQPETKVAPMKDNARENAKAAPPKTKPDQTAKNHQPVISTEETEWQNSVTAEENKMLPGVILAEKDKKEETPATNSATSPVAVAVLQKNAEDDYKTIAQVVNEKLRKVLGIKKENNCGENENLTWWDLAMAAKQGIQNLAGSKAVDINKKCKGKGKKAEYYFAAGNFEITGKFSK